MKPTIVVGVDGSTDSGQALDWAADEARQRRCAVQVLYGLHMPMAAVPFSGAVILPPSDDLREYAESVLAEATERVTRAAPDVDVSAELVLSHPAEALLAASARATLIVVGTRGLSALGALALGSVSSRVAAKAACPTVVVPSTEHRGRNGGTIVVGVDGSAHSDAALRFALAEAALRSSKLVAIHAYPTPAAATPVFDPTVADQLGAGRRRRAEKLVEDAVDRVAEASEAARPTTRAVAGNPADVLVDEVPDAAMVVIGSRGRGRTLGMLLGSVSQSVLRHASCPVAVVHADAAHTDT